jgi:hypothetical protein
MESFVSSLTSRQVIKCKMSLIKVSNYIPKPIFCMPNIDIGLGSMSVMAERETVIDFTVPYYDLVGKFKID